MKRWFAGVVCVFLLLGCSPGADPVEKGMTLRTKLLEGKGCAFSAAVTADYGDYLHTFVMLCTADPSGAVQFTVTAPESISGITGAVNGEGGKLTFDEEVLLFSPLADGQLAPVTAPWVIVKALRSGYLVSCGETGQGSILTVDDSYAEDALRLEIRLDDRDLPVSAEIYWQGRRILSVRIEHFEIL